LDLETLNVEGATLATINLGLEAILGLEVETVINLFAPNACWMDTASSFSRTLLTLDIANITMKKDRRVVKKSP
jgi:hypothetical protein